jgi:CheY-like chemotaxis protein
MATIMVVDDSPVSRHLLSFTLRREGHAVVALPCARQALALLTAEPVDLVVADLNMPGMDGLALLRSIRASEELGGVPMLMLTASGADKDRVEAQAAGVAGFLTKPASSRALAEAVRALLSAPLSAARAP